MIEYRVEPEMLWVAKRFQGAAWSEIGCYDSEAEAVAAATQEARAELLELGLPPDSPEVKMPGAWEDDAPATSRAAPPCPSCGLTPSNCPVGFPGCSYGDLVP